MNKKTILILSMIFVSLVISNCVYAEGFGESFYIESEGQSSTSSTSWQDKATLTFSPSESGNYLIIATAELKENSGSYDLEVRMTIDSVTKAEADWEPDESNKWEPFFSHKIVNLDTSQHTIKIQYSIENDDKTAYIRRARIIAIKIDDYEYNETESEIQPSQGSYDDISTITFTPPSTGDYLILGTAEIKPGHTNKDIYARLIVDGQEKALAQRQAERNGDWLGFGTHKIINLDTTSHTIKIQSMKDPSGGTNQRIRRSRLSAIRLNDFETVSSDSFSTASSSAWVNKTELTFTPSETKDYLVLVSSDLSHTSAVNGRNPEQRYLIDETENGDQKQGISASTDKFSFLSIKNKSFDTNSHTIRHQFRRASGSGTSGVKNVRISTISLNSATAPPEENITIYLEESGSGLAECNLLIENSTGEIYNETNESHGVEIAPGLYNLTVGPTNQSKKIKKMKFFNVNVENGSNITIDYDDLNKTEEGEWEEAYAIDPSSFDFSEANVTINSAIGDQLYKCVDWNFTNKTCGGDWTFLANITPGQEYNITLTPTDPAFAESFIPGNEAHDVDIAILDDETGMFVMAWCTDNGDDAAYQVLYTNGTAYGSVVTFDAAAGDSCRIAVSALNDTAFVIAYADWVFGSSDWTIGGVDIDNNIVIPVFDVDTDTNSFVDVGVCALNSSIYASVFLDDQQNDATYVVYDMSTPVQGQTDLDTGANPGTRDMNLVDCAAISSNSWVFAYYDDNPDENAFAMYNATGGETKSRTVIGASALDGGVAVAGLANGGFVITYCDSTDDDVSFTTYDSSGNSVSGEVDVDTDISTCNAASGTKIEVSSLNTTDGKFVIIYDDTASDDAYIAVYNYSGTEILAPQKLNDTDLSDKAVSVAGYDTIRQKTACKYETEPIIIAYNSQAPDAIWDTYYANGTHWDGTCVTPPDITPPTFTNNQTQLVATYSPTEYSNFSITWSDPNFANAYLENNFTGSLTNTTMSGSYPNFYYNSSVLSAGTYQYRFVANDTGGYSNATDVITFTISQASSSVTLTFNPSSTPQTYGTALTATCTENNPEAAATFTRNGTAAENNTATTLGADTYEYICSVSGTQNYTGDSNTSYFTIAPASPDLHIAVNGSETNQEYQQGNATNASAWETNSVDSDCTYNFYRDGSPTSNPEITTLAVGNYTYLYNTSGCTNFTTGSITRLLNITTPPDTTPPTFSNNQTQLVATYSPSVYSNFSTDWSDPNYC